MTLSEEVLEALGRKEWSVATAESLTGGLVVAALVDVPGASTHVRGGIVAYATDLKARVLGVDEALLARDGPVAESVARQMADGARRALGADVGLATTGVAGPDPQGRHAVGTVVIAVATPAGSSAATLSLSGSRESIRAKTVAAVLRLCLGVLDEIDR